MGRKRRDKMSQRRRTPAVFLSANPNPGHGSDGMGSSLKGQCLLRDEVRRKAGKIDDGGVRARNYLPTPTDLLELTLKGKAST